MHGRAVRAMPSSKRASSSTSSVRPAKAKRQQKKRSANFSVDESRVLIESYKEHKPSLDGVIRKGGPNPERNEVWDLIFRCFRESFPETKRTAGDLRGKISKLSSIARKMYQKERLEARGMDLPAPRIFIPPGVKMMMDVMKDDFAFEDPESDSEFVEYEVEFDDHALWGSDNEDEKEDKIHGNCKDAQTDQGKTKMKDDSVEEEDSDIQDEEVESVNPEEIIRNILIPEHSSLDSPEHNPVITVRPGKASQAYEAQEGEARISSQCEGRRVTKRRQTARKEEETRNGSGDDKTGGPEGDEPQPPKRRSSMLQTRAQEILDLQKAKLLIERDNLLLVQRKLRLEVKLAERQLQEASSRGNRCSECGKSTSNSNEQQSHKKTDPNNDAGPS